MWIYGLFWWIFWWEKWGAGRQDPEARRAKSVKSAKHGEARRGVYISDGFSNLTGTLPSADLTREGADGPVA